MGSSCSCSFSLFGFLCLWWVLAKWSNGSYTACLPRFGDKYFGVPSPNALWCHAQTMLPVRVTLTANNLLIPASVALCMSFHDPAVRPAPRSWLFNRVAIILPHTGTTAALWRAA